MIWYWQIIFQVVALLWIFGVCDFHYHWFKANKKVGPWFHFLWGCSYFIPTIWLGWIVFSDWKVVLLFAAERFVFYNPLLNKMRGMPLFYLSVNSDNPSWWDKVELKWKGAYPYVWGVSVAAYLAIQFFV